MLLPWTRLGIFKLKITYVVLRKWLFCARRKLVTKLLATLSWQNNFFVFRSKSQECKKLKAEIFDVQRPSSPPFWISSQNLQFFVPTTKQSQQEQGLLDERLQELGVHEHSQLGGGPSGNVDAEGERRKRRRWAEKGERKSNCKLLNSYYNWYKRSYSVCKYIFRVELCRKLQGFVC